LGVAGSVGGLALLRVNARAQGPQLYRLRPPGAEEQHLLSACVRCGACLRACPTHGLQPALSEAGLEGLWTPILMPRLGNCDYGCTACGETCPTGAIPLLSLADKRLAVIGKARIDPVRCLAWSKQAPCIVCEEMCPLPAKAITLIEQEARWPDGSAYTLQLPVVTADRCIGCGLCEKKCPVSGEAAIRVTIDPLG
jgi:MauM/NapG family ferredoxin protein